MEENSTNTHKFPIKPNVNWDHTHTNIGYDNSIRLGTNELTHQKGAGLSSDMSGNLVVNDSPVITENKLRSIIEEILEIKKENDLLKRFG